MFLSDALDIHRSFKHEHGIGDVLGDGFLLQSNDIYRNVRRVALDVGCTFVEAYPDYLLLPFHELPKIVASKKIPYVPHARLMSGVESSRPGAFTTDDVPMPESYHLHESAHVIAEQYFATVKLRNDEEKILKAILCESFANTIDALVSASATSEIHHFLIKLNCYMHPQKKVMQAMTALQKDLGFSFVFMLTFFTYVQANFLAKPLSKKAVKGLADQFAPGKKLSTKQRKDVQAVMDIGEKLDPRFRVTTTGNYLKGEGFDGEIEDLLNFPFMQTFATNKGFAKALEGLCDAVS